MAADTQNIPVTQGSSKVRLVARDGRYRETATTRSLRMQNLRNEIPDATYNRLMSTGAGTGGNELSDYYIEFDTTPDISESGSVSYFEAGEIRGPGSIMFYMGSPARNFTITAKLVARNAAEAERVSKQIHVLKSWRQPESYTGGINAGTPTILYLQGYGKMFKDIPVVITDLNIDFSSEFDYISSSESSNIGGVQARDKNQDGKKEYNPVVMKYDASVPIITPVTISLKEARSVEGDLEGLETFDILKYRTGELYGW
jgi:hypothetical protein